MLLSTLRCLPLNTLISLTQAESPRIAENIETKRSVQLKTEMFALDIFVKTRLWANCKGWVQFARGSGLTQVRRHYQSGGFILGSRDWKRELHVISK